MRIYHVADLINEHLQGNVTIEQYDNICTQMGQKPVNPLGHCFDATALNLFLNAKEGAMCMELWHGLGVTRFPGQEDEKMAHAWIEQGSMAFDCIWGLALPIIDYRKSLRLTYSVSYPQKKALQKFRKTDYPGPWDRVIKEYFKEEYGVSLGGCT